MADIHTKVCTYTVHCTQMVGYHSNS